MRCLESLSMTISQDNALEQALKRATAEPVYRPAFPSTGKSEMTDR
ncbi:MAG: hypothetical protein GPOALKHO_000140 [Sodalis sp.]|nr:MAG: hypothetical protein GPOALKHO_000140 [Sodalis sp.]